MKNIFILLALPCAVCLFLVMTLDSERQIESLQHELNNRENTIDSLHKQIDTLNYRLEIWDDFPSSSTINALIFVESSNNDSAYNPGEDAVGCLQIRRTMVRDVNRILGEKICGTNPLRIKALTVDVDVLAQVKRKQQQQTIFSVWGISAPLVARIELRVSKLVGKLRF